MLIAMLLACAPTETAAADAVDLYVLDYWLCRSPGFAAHYTNDSGEAASLAAIDDISKGQGGVSIGSCKVEADTMRDEVYFSTAWGLAGDGDGDIFTDQRYWTLDRGEEPPDGTLVIAGPIVLGETVQGGGGTVASIGECQTSADQCVEVVLHSGIITGELLLASNGYPDVFDLDQVPGGPWYLDE